jgi:mannosyltransferase OCH1-like enzyme
MNIASAVHYRLKLHAPRALAHLTRQLPLRSGAALYTSVPPINRPIPNIVYQTWQNTYFGREHLNSLGAFRAMNADYGFELFDDAAIDAYMASAWGGTEIERIYRKGVFGPMRTDIWRYCILYERGGVYCDIGKALAAPITEIVPTAATAVVSFERNRHNSPACGKAARALQHPDMRVLNWALMAAAGHPLFKRVIDGIVAKYPNYAGRVVADPKLAILHFTGPIHLTECVHAHAAETGMCDVHQAGTDFDNRALIELPGSYVRYIQQPSYAAARDALIVR